jgi:hypothetical protein
MDLCTLLPVPDRGTLTPGGSKQNRRPELSRRRFVESHALQVALSIQGAAGEKTIAKDLIMPKLKIEDGSPHEPGVVYLRLVETDPDHVMLEAIYDYGGADAEDALYLPGGGLLVITAEGRVALSPNVGPELGFPLDHDGRLQLDAYCEAQTARRAKSIGKRAVLLPRS